MSNEEGQSNCGSSRGYRDDLEGRLPIVYNGKSVEEWYTLYCQEVLRHQRLIGVATEFITDSYRPTPKHDAERFDKLRDALGIKPEGSSSWESSFDPDGEMADEDWGV